MHKVALECFGGVMDAQYLLSKVQEISKYSEHSDAKYIYPCKRNINIAILLFWCNVSAKLKIK